MRIKLSDKGAGKTSADHAVWLYRLNYDRITGVCKDDLVNRITVRAREATT
ncbi:MAG: hypothetical protein ACRD63_00940 [Pyrinomonadaceae bacterium]